MRMSGALVLGAFVVGGVVGLTGMGGGALMTPMLVLLFGVSPLTAVSSDLVASAVMKPVGSLVHLRKRTVNLQLVKWLCVGSVPSAFLGVVFLRALGEDEKIQTGIRTALGVAILLTATMLIVRVYLRLLNRARPSPSSPDQRLHVRPLPTVALGVLGGLIVGMTSVGSGSLIIIGLMFLYPTLLPKQLVGTDLLQAVPLVTAAAVSHVFFGDLDLAVSLPLILGGVPGAYLGARLATVLPGGVVRRALAVVLIASGLKLLGVPNLYTAVVLVVVSLGGSLLWMHLRRRHGFPALASVESREVRKRSDKKSRSGISAKGDRSREEGVEA